MAHSQPAPKPFAFRFAIDIARPAWLCLDGRPNCAMSYIIPNIIAVLAGVILTVVKCRRAQARHQCAQWSFAFVGASLAGVIAVALIDRWALLHLGVFSNQVPVWGAVFLDFIFAGAVALSLASVVVYHYR